MHTKHCPLFTSKVVNVSGLITGAPMANILLYRNGISEICYWFIYRNFLKLSPCIMHQSTIHIHTAPDLSDGAPTTNTSFH